MRKINILSVAILVVLSIVSCSKRQNLTGVYHDIHNTDYRVEIQKADKGYIVKFPNGGESPAQYVSETDDDKLEFYHKALSYSSIEECKDYESGYERAGAGTLIIGKGGEWVNVLTKSDIERMSEKYFLNLNADKKYLRYINAYGQEGIWEKIDGQSTSTISNVLKPESKKNFSVLVQDKSFDEFFESFLKMLIENNVEEYSKAFYKLPNGKIYNEEKLGRIKGWTSKSNNGFAYILNEFKNGKTETKNWTKSELSEQIKGSSEDSFLLNAQECVTIGFNDKKGLVSFAKINDKWFFIGGF